jgi:ABC-2 type transport system ATP-binding protein
MDEAQHLCDRVAVIDHGRVVALDTPDGLASRVSATQKLRFTPSAPIDVSVLRALPSVRSVTVDNGDHVEVVGGAEVVTDVVLALNDQGARAMRLRVDQAGLEDAFVAVVDREDDRQVGADRGEG